jgi:hypothetical protein
MKLFDIEIQRKEQIKLRKDNGRQPPVVGRR